MIGGIRWVPPIAFVAVLVPVLASAEPVRYRVRAAVTENDIVGSVSIEIDPVGAAKLDTVALFLFPNILQERLHGEDAKSFYTIHPWRFRPGGMQLTSLKTKSGEDVPWTGLKLERPDGKGGSVRLPEGTAILATLPAPAEGTVELEAEFRVHVPERFGTFSWYRGDLLLNGGWFPMVAPRDAAGAWDLDGALPRVDVDVEVETAGKRWVLLDRVVSEPEGTPRKTVKASIASRPTALLVVSNVLHEYPLENVRVLQQKDQDSYGKREARIAQQAEKFLEREGLGDGKTAVVYEASLTRELAFHDAPISLLSFRTYRVFPPMKRYHDVHAARAVIAASIRDRVYELEGDEDASWVLDAAAWHLARRWEHEKHEGLRDVRDYARPLSFIPAVDLVLNTPDFPFAAEYYDNWYFTDLIRDDVSRFNHLRPNGRVVYEKLADRVGAEKAALALETYLHGTKEDGGFQAVAEKVTGEDLDELFETWRAPLPRVNYKLQNVRTERLPSGQWMSVLTMVRQGDPVVEPVRVRARADGGAARGTWESSADAGTVYLFTKQKPRAVEVDWRNRLLESTRRDNRLPPAFRVLLQYAYVDYEFKLNTADMGFALLLERTNDIRNQVDLVGFRRQQSTGGAIGYVRNAGEFTFYRGLMHRFGTYLLVEDLAKNFGRTGLHVVPGFDPSVNRVESTVGLLASYRYDDREDWRFSRTGTRVYAAAESGVSFIGPPSRYFLVGAEVIKQHRLSDNNVLAWQAKAGTFAFTDPADVPLSKLYYLGGTEDVRGISAPEIVGPTKFVVSAEWRHYWLHDLDWNLWIERMRGLQGSFFFDAGYIAPRTTSVPPMNDWVTTVGYGFRQHYDFLGVRPMLLRLDVAQRTDDLDVRGKGWELDLRFYIGAGQSF